ncbi:MAG TPA: ABC transporter ATP-binding protein [Solirubrobacteraceae bacterium]|jgi:branched-chain amino acid transport system ATP-binding protein|nr:ABC transporter ATP-binding protein [Solirubrobacteraceae bacterium]
MLEVTGLAAGYGRVQVLWDVDLEVGEGEVVALVGSNGAGKTTLLRAVSGMITLTGGEVCLAGDSLVGRAPEEAVRAGIAHVPEGRRLFAGLTVRENLRVGAYVHGEHEDIDRAVELFPRLGERLDQVAGSLSGGEQQMCAIARGLMANPKLIMIDELSLGLAPKLVEQILERLTSVTEAGTAVLLVEQDVDAALEAAARGYVLENGRIVASGESSALLEDPRIREAYLGVA